MKGLFLVLLGVYFLIGLSCQEKGTEPQPSYPSGYQHDIPWPSLADSPWPINHGDPQSTGRSKYSGAQKGLIDFSIQLNDSHAGTAIGPDSTIYVIAYNKLIALKLDGKTKWEFLTKYPIYTTPLISKENIIYLCDVGGNGLKAINSDGILKWSKNIKVVSQLITINRDGTLICLDENRTLYALDQSGNIKWSITDQRFNYYSLGISISPDGGTLYIPGIDVSLLAFDIASRSVKWTYGNQTMVSSPIVEYNGKIIVFVIQSNNDGFISQINPDGTQQWIYQFKSPTDFTGSVPTIDKNGNIYFATDTLYKISYDGNLEWKIALNKLSDCPIISDCNNRVYVGMDSPGLSEISMECYDSQGNLIWNMKENNQRQVGGSPAIGNNGRIYLPTWASSKFYCIK